MSNNKTTQTQDIQTLSKQINVDEKGNVVINAQTFAKFAASAPTAAEIRKPQARTVMWVR